MGKKILGLDIQNHAVAAVIVNSGLRTSRIESYTFIPFDDPSVEDGGLSAALDILTQRLDVGGSVCVVSLPPDQASFRNLQVPFKQVKKIRQILPFELEPSLPFPVEEVVIDFHPIRNDALGEATDLIAAAYETSGMRFYLEQLSARHIEPRIVTVGAYAAAICLCRLGNVPPNSLLVDVGDDSSTMFVLADGQLRLVRSIPAGSRKPFRPELLCQNIQRTLFALEELVDPGYLPEQMLITGPAVGRNGLAADMGQMLNIPTVPTDLTRDTENRIDEFPADAWRPHQMNNALALALLEVLGIKGLNFRRGPFAIRKRWAEYKQNITVAAILAGVLVLMMLTNVFLDYRARSQRLEMLNRRITEIFQTTFPEVTRVVDPVQQMRVNIQELKGSSLSVSDSGNQLPAVDILNEISRRIPAEVDVQFSRLILADDSAVISGDSDTFNSVDTIKGSLESSDIFQEVTIVSTTKEAKDNRIRFRLRIKL